MKYLLLSIFILFSHLLHGQDTIPEQITPNEYFLEGMRYFNEGNLENARQLLNDAITSDSANDAAHFYLGLTYFKLGDPQAGEAYLIKAQKMDPDNVWYKIKLAEHYAESGKTAQAISVYENICETHPEKHSIYYDIIDLYTISAQYDKALETLDRIETLKGENEITGEVRYELYIRQGDYTEALAHLSEYYKKYPTPRVALVLGDLNKSMYKDSLATHYYNEALRMEPGYPAAHFGLAEIYRSARKYTDYFSNINIFLQSQEMDVNIKVRYMKEVVMAPHIIRQHMKDVDVMVNSIMCAHPQDTAAIYMCGTYYYQTGRDSLGTLLFRGAVESYPEDFRANIEYVSALYYQQRWSDLAQQLERSLHYFPQETSFTELLPVAYWQAGELDKAIAFYQKELDALSPRDTTAYRHLSSLGDLYHEKGDIKMAYKMYNKTLKLKPDYNPTLNNYAYYLCLQGKSLKKAEKMSHQTITTEPDNPTYLDTYAWILYTMGEYSEAKNIIKRAMIYGGNQDPTMLDHYAEILFALKEYELAFIYWEQADKMDPTLGIGAKSKERKLQIKR